MEWSGGLGRWLGVVVVVGLVRLVGVVRWVNVVMRVNRAMLFWKTVVIGGCALEEEKR